MYTWIERMVLSEGILRYWPFKIMRKRSFWNYPGTQAYLDSKTFSDFIRHPKIVQFAPGFKPQFDWISDSNGHIIVDYIGKVESIIDDFDFIKKQINNEQIQLDVYNESTRNKKRSLKIKRDDYEYLHDLFKIDFETFNYDINPY